jgi:hypothetical protein
VAAATSFHPNMFIFGGRRGRRLREASILVCGLVSCLSLCVRCALCRLGHSWYVKVVS